MTARTSGQSTSPTEHHFGARTVWIYIRLCVGGLLVALLGSLIYRSGADCGIPWGLAIAWALAFFYACLCRKDKGASGVALSVLVSTMCVWAVATHPGPGEDILVPGASSAFTTWMSQTVSYWWIIGVAVVQLFAFCVPISRLRGKGLRSGTGLRKRI
jgi:hypothetical protein